MGALCWSQIVIKFFQWDSRKNKPYSACSHSKVEPFWAHTNVTRPGRTNTGLRPFPHPVSRLSWFYTEVKRQTRVWPWNYDLWNSASIKHPLRRRWGESANMPECNSNLTFGKESFSLRINGLQTSHLSISLPAAYPGQDCSEAWIPSQTVQGTRRGTSWTRCQGPKWHLANLPLLETMLITAVKLHQTRLLMCGCTFLFFVYLTTLPICPFLKAFCAKSDTQMLKGWHKQLSREFQTCRIGSRPCAFHHFCCLKTCLPRCPATRATPDKKKNALSGWQKAGHEGHIWKTSACPPEIDIKYTQGGHLAPP